MLHFPNLYGQKIHKLKKLLEDMQSEYHSTRPGVVKMKIGVPLLRKIIEEIY